MNIADNTNAIEIPKLTLPELVAALPEIYQPIFGYPEFSSGASRLCEDRLEQILRIYDLFSAKLGRPLRVLDLGCAQGFFSLHLAQRGAVVFGVDHSRENIAVCKALGAENPDLKVGFGRGQIEELINGMPPDNCDLVLGLSVFHHLVTIHGIPAVQNMLKTLSQKATLGLFEMARADEPPAWAKAQPKNPRDLLDDFAFVHQFTQTKTHLSEIARPFFVTSNHYWVLDEQIEFFDEWKKEAHILSNNANEGTRRYYIGKGKLAKVFRLDNPKWCDSNLNDQRREVSFLENPPLNFRAPRGFLHGVHESEAWSVRECMEGELLLDIQRKAKSYDAPVAVRDILQQLVALEAAGLYHNDVRAWNILITPNGHAQLIDYGAIGSDPTDCAWPYNIFLSFIIFMNEVFGASVEIAVPIRKPLLDPTALPEPYARAVHKMLKLSPKKWRFAHLSQLITQSLASPSKRKNATHSGYAVLAKATNDLREEFHTYWKNHQ